MLDSFLCIFLCVVFHYCVFSCLCFVLNFFPSPSPSPSLLSPPSFPPPPPLAPSLPPLHHVLGGVMKKFRITQLPPYLILHIKRFTKNNWFVEKNPTVVTFPLKNLDFKECILDLIMCTSRVFFF